MISVIVPVYNESANLLNLYRQVREVLQTLDQPWELILVNDGSTDTSQARLDELSALDTAVKVITLRRNFGQTAAMMAGMDYASGDILIPMDGDLQNDPCDIPRLLEKLEEGFDVVSGWRSVRHDSPIKRVFLSRIANRLISFISGVPLHDYGCSLKAYRRDVIKDVRLYGEMHRFIPIYASWFGARITEIPVTHHARQFGKSKYGMERTFKVMFDLMVVKFLSRYSQKPMYVFGTVGFLSLAVSLLSGIWALYLKFVDHVSFISTPLPLLVVMTGITGFMCILMGLLAELIMRTYYESQGKSVYLVSETRNLARKPD
ncbi:MAG: glycosyltransferase family 2 protein [Rugosibacter sp.]|nr:glycosyltransferase family 2 protein [Rugosibacter sp.]